MGLSDLNDVGSGKRSVLESYRVMADHRSAAYQFNQAEPAPGAPAALPTSVPAAIFRFLRYSNKVETLSDEAGVIWCATPAQIRCYGPNVLSDANAGLSTTTAVKLKKNTALGILRKS